MLKTVFTRKHSEWIRSEHFIGIPASAGMLSIRGDCGSPRLPI